MKIFNLRRHCDRSPQSLAPNLPFPHNTKAESNNLVLDKAEPQFLSGMFSNKLAASKIGGVFQILLNGLIKIENNTLESK